MIKSVNPDNFGSSTMKNFKSTYQHDYKDIPSQIAAKGKRRPQSGRTPSNPKTKVSINIDYRKTNS